MQPTSCRAAAGTCLSENRRRRFLRLRRYAKVEARGGWLLPAAKHGGMAEPARYVPMEAQSAAYLLGRNRIDHARDPGNAVGRKAALRGVLPDHLLVGCDVNTINLVVGH